MLTAKQNQLLHFIAERLNESGISPSFDEMKDALGLKSKSGVHRLIKALEERGFLGRLPNRARALEVLKMPESAAPAMEQTNVVRPSFGKPGLSSVPASSSDSGAVEVPMHGRIAAGTPIEALEQSESFLSIPPSMLGRGDTYGLEISGDSMIDLGIMDGDTVLIERCDTARDGEVVVALVDGEEATLKTIKRQGAHITLIPANRTHETQILESHRVKVQGRLIGLMRQYH